MLLTALLPGCGSFASFNEPLASSISRIAPGGEPESPSPAPSKSSPRELCGFDYPDPAPHLVGLTLSGGGARAAALSSAVIFELADLGLLDEVDVISGASGGALAAAFYAVTCDPEDDEEQCKRALDPARQVSRRKWERKEVYERLSRDFISRSLWSRAWPVNLALMTFTAYDNTDVFASVLSDNPYDSPYLGTDFVFADINPKRPLLVINATNVTGRPRNPKRLADSPLSLTFTFTHWSFAQLHSDICSFEIGRAAAASSAYPAVFNYSTLARYKDDGASVTNAGYLHLFDAGASDNLATAGLLSALDRLVPTEKTRDGRRVDRITVFMVDAQNGFGGRPPDMSDPRFLLDRIVDRNFIDVYDTLMQRNYSFTINGLDSSLRMRGFA